MARNGFEPAPVETRFADAVFAGPQVSVEGFDPVDLLPERAADKLRALRQRAADLHMLVPQFEQVDQINTERIKCDRELKRLTAAASDNGFNLPPEDHRVITTQRRLNKLSDETCAADSVEGNANGDVARCNQRAFERRRLVEEWQTSRHDD